MPRPPRAFLPDYPQHLIQRGNNRTAIFLADADYAFYYNCLLIASQKYICPIHAYVLMTNHVHLLTTPAYPDSLARLMQCIGRRYVRYFNGKYRRSGTLWEGRFKASLVDTDRYLLSCYHYIELNPVRAHLVNDPADYPWSSYCSHALGQPNPLVTSHGVYLALDSSEEKRQAAYRTMCASTLENRTLHQIREAANKGWVLGGQQLMAAAEAAAHQALRPLPRGRPKRSR